MYVINGVEAIEGQQEYRIWLEVVPCEYYAQIYVTATDIINRLKKNIHKGLRRFNDIRMDAKKIVNYAIYNLIPLIVAGQWRRPVMAADDACKEDASLGLVWRLEDGSLGLMIV